VLEQTARPGGLYATFTKEGFTFPCFTTLAHGFEPGGGIERLLMDLNLTLEKRPWIPACKSSCLSTALM